MVAYLVFTSLLMLPLLPQLADATGMAILRLQILGGMVACMAVYWLYPCRATRLLRCIYQLAMLAQWYPDTYAFNSTFPNLDHVFAGLEQTLFGGQPSLWFSQAVPSLWFSEAVNLGYWSYYPMIGVVCLWYFFRNYEQFSRCCFVVLASFFAYYIIYIFLPVAGPQFYFQAIGVDQAAAGHFPSMGHYFASHTDMLPAPGDANGFFRSLVASAQDTGERPTAAFPSSHIGMSTIILLLAGKSSRRLACALLPFYVLLCMATVYIQAHYLVDAICGMLSAPLVMLLMQRLYKACFRH